VEINRAGREFLVQLCGELGLGHIPSQGNFVMIDVVRPAVEVYDALLRLGVIVRPVAGRGTWLRVSVGLPVELERFGAALRAVLGGAVRSAE
jgi:histidinol-phosphate aminotransferase